MRDRPNDEGMAESFRTDPVFAIELLISTLADGHEGELSIVLRQMALAFGGVPAVVGASIRSQPSQNVEFDGDSAMPSLAGALKAINLRLVIEPIESPTAQA